MPRLQSQYLQKNLLFPAFIIIMCIAAISCRKEIKQTDKAVAGVETNNAVAAGKPNVLIILSDDIGYEIPGCTGGQSYSTPNINALAAGGKLYTNCYSSPICSPSRFMLLTGKYNFRNYIQWGRMTTDQKTIANMLGDAGYATCYTGKWQLDGGDNSIRSEFGWQKYSVYLPFYQEYEQQEGSRYKSTKIYQDGGYMPASYSLNKFSDDIFTDYLLNFTDSMQNESKPFLALYSMILCHKPYSPTPDDPEFETWDFTNQISNISFYPSMVSYMDKKIGQIINHLDSTGQLDNTVIIYLADNGTPDNVTSMFNGFPVVGSKSESTEIGSSVPLIVSWRNKAVPGISTTMVDFTDLLPTLAQITKTPKPTTWGVLDGVSFYKTIISAGNLQLRKNIYDAYMNEVHTTGPFERWVQSTQYKLYDTVVGVEKSGLFMKVQKCRPDTILDVSTLTPEEKQIRKGFLRNLAKFRADTSHFISPMEEPKN